MTDTPLPFEKEVEAILNDIGWIIDRSSGTLFIESDGITPGQAKAALIAAHKKEVERVIGHGEQWQPIQDTNPWAQPAYVENELRKRQLKRAGIEPEEK